MKIMSKTLLFKMKYMTFRNKLNAVEKVKNVEEVKPLRFLIFLN
jgi:hypothetical protein